MPPPASPGRPAPSTSRAGCPPPRNTGSTGPRAIGPHHRRRRTSADTGTRDQPTSPAPTPSPTSGTHPRPDARPACPLLIPDPPSGPSPAPPLSPKPTDTPFAIEAGPRLEYDTPGRSRALLSRSAPNTAPRTRGSAVTGAIPTDAASPPAAPAPGVDRRPQRPRTRREHMAAQPRRATHARAPRPRRAIRCVE